MKERIKFTTPNTTMKELVANGYDSDMANKIVSVASIIKAFTKNVEIDVSSPGEFMRGEFCFYMKNHTEEERFNNRVAYKVLVNLIDPAIKVGAFLWPDDDNGTRDDVIDVNFFGYTFNVTSNGGQAESEDQAKKEEQAREQGRKLAREEAELWLREAAERLNQGGKSEVDENIPVNPMRLMNLWSSDDNDDDDDIELWANERYSFGEDE